MSRFFDERAKTAKEAAHARLEPELPATDRHAIDQLVIEHLPVALRFAQRLCGNADVAEELVQETLCRVLRQWKTFRGESAFSTWMLQIVLNVDRDRRRRLRPFEELPAERLVDSQPNAHQAVAAGETQQQIRNVIYKLPERQREVALLAFGEAYTAVEVAEVLQISIANVHTCLHLARKRIATAIGVNHPKQAKE